MLAVSPMMINSLRCNSSANFSALDKNLQPSFFSIQPYSNPPDHYSLRSVVLCGCSSGRSSFSLQKERFASEAQALLGFLQQDDEVAEEDPGLEEETKKKKKKSSPYLAVSLNFDA